MLRLAAGCVARTLALLLPALLVGCNDSDAARGAEVPAATVPAVTPAAAPAGTAAPVPGASSATPAAAQFVIEQDFPDPDVLAVDDGYLAFATNSAGVNVQVAWSRDLAAWQLRRDDALPTLPAWASRGRTWAPEVSMIGGRYVMYFTAQDWASGRQCIGVAVASRPEGPYDSPAAKPLVCPTDEGGAIDATTFIDDDGSAWLVYKTDGNCCRLPTRIMLVRLSSDGTALTGVGKELIRQTQRWEGALVEAPTLVRRDGRYLLFYSANDYASGAYAVGYAIADAIDGPYTKADGPFLATGSDGQPWHGPGGQDVVVGRDGRDRLVFHGWDRALRYRGMSVAPLSWNDGRPMLAAPAG